MTFMFITMCLSFISVLHAYSFRLAVIFVLKPGHASHIVLLQIYSFITYAPITPRAQLLASSHGGIPVPSDRDTGRRMSARVVGRGEMAGSHASAAYT